MVKTTSKSKYKVELRIDKKVFKSENEDLLTALNDLNLTRQDVFYKGIFTISKGKKKVEKMMFNNQLKRFATNDLAKIVWVKTWKSILDNE